MSSQFDPCFQDILDELDANGTDNFDYVHDFDNFNHFGNLSHSDDVNAFGDVPAPHQCFEASATRPVASETSTIPTLALDIIAITQDIDVNHPAEQAEDPWTHPTPAGVISQPGGISGTGPGTSQSTRPVPPGGGNCLMEGFVPQKCRVESCTSNETFQTSGALRRHHRNVHENPLVCLVNGCGRTKAFSRPADLNRHMKTAHGDANPYKCPVVSCDEHENGFRRKDYLTTHIKNKHDHLRCTLQHCHDIVLETEHDLHMEKSYGPYECEVGGCTGPSRFLKRTLNQHLRTHHRISGNPTWMIMMSLGGTESYTVNLTKARRLRRLQDCKWCITNLNTNGNMANINAADS